MSSFRDQASTDRQGLGKTSLEGGTFKSSNPSDASQLMNNVMVSKFNNKNQKRQIAEQKGIHDEL
jgi:hypothetical protein